MQTSNAIVRKADPEEIPIISLANLRISIDVSQWNGELKCIVSSVGVEKKGVK
jgi:hypothetical protein